MNRISKVVLFLGVLLVTLINHGLLSWTIGVFLLTVFMIAEKVSIKKKSLIETFVLITLLILAIFRFQLFVIYEVDAVFRDAFFGNTYRYVLCIGTWFIVRNISLDKKRRHLTETIVPLLKLHVSIFFTQFIVYFSTGYYIDLLKLTTGLESRYRSFDSTLIGIGSFRPTGLFSEPSNYTMVVLTLAILIIVYNKYDKHKKLIALTIVSMFLSFSTAAVFTAGLFVVYIVISEKLYKKLLLIIPMVLIIIITSATLYTLIQVQTDRLDGRAGNLRMELIRAILNRDSDKVIMADGAYGMETDFYKKVANQGREDRVSSTNDAGILVYMWARFGYLGILSFIIISILMYRISKKNLFLFLILSLTKLSVFYPLFPLYLALSLSSNLKYSLKKPEEVAINSKS